MIFAREYLVDFNATAAAIRAGYSESYAHDACETLLKDPAIKKIVEDSIRRREALAEKNADWVLEQISFIAATAKFPNSRLRALELMGRAYGMFTENVRLGNPDGTPLFSGEITIKLVKSDA